MYRKHFEGNRPVGRDRFEYILDKYNLKVRKKKRKPRTTDSHHGLPTYPNQAPQEAATHTGEIKKGWTSYRDIAIKNLQTENIVSNKCLSLGA